MKKSGGRCWYCGIKIHPFHLAKEAATVDHVESRVSGGTDDEENLVPCCRPCNSAKCHRTVDDFRPIAAQRHTGAPRFTSDQIEWLKGRGLYTDPLDGFLFWFEKRTKTGTPLCVRKEKAE